jgi:hypothetical protein
MTKDPAIAPAQIRKAKSKIIAAHIGFHVAFIAPEGIPSSLILSSLDSSINDTSHFL